MPRACRGCGTTSFQTNRMTKAGSSLTSPMRKFTALLILPVLLFLNGCEPKVEPDVEGTPKEAMRKMAQAAGVDGFASIKSISYTFHADLGDKAFVRSWTWLPESNTVTLHGRTSEEDVRYQRAKMDSDPSGSLAETDKQFVNDLYWLIFPIQVAWDPGVSVEPLPEDAAAVVPDAFAGLRVRFPDGVGYTPGDVYDLFYDQDHRITNWVFRKGGGADPTMVSEWKEYETFGPLSISLNRPAPDQSVRIWFENVAVELMK